VWNTSPLFSPYGRLPRSSPEGPAEDPGAGLLAPSSHAREGKGEACRSDRASWRPCRGVMESRRCRARRRGRGGARDACGTMREAFGRDHPGGRRRSGDGAETPGYGRAAGRERAAAMRRRARRGWVIPKRSRRRVGEPLSMFGPRLGHMRHRDAAACSRPHACAARRRRPAAEELSLAGMATVLRARLQLGALPP